MARLLQLPWVTGARWAAEGLEGKAGTQVVATYEYSRGSTLRLTLCFRQPPSPAVCWHVNWLLRLAAEFYLVKRRTRELNRVAYQQAVYDGGPASPTEHKTCSSRSIPCATRRPSPGSRRRWPTFSGVSFPDHRAPEGDPGKAATSARVADDLTQARGWWESLQQRYSGAAITWVNGYWHEGAMVPKGLFDSVARSAAECPGQGTPQTVWR